MIVFVATRNILLCFMLVRAKCPLLPLSQLTGILQQQVGDGDCSVSWKETSFTPAFSFPNKKTSKAKNVTEN